MELSVGTVYINPRNGIQITIDSFDEESVVFETNDKISWGCLPRTMLELFLADWHLHRR